MISNIPFKDFGGSGAVFHFAHANGFPPDTYRQMLRPLTEKYHVIASSFRPLWPNATIPDVKNWQKFADDFISFLDQQGCKNIVGAGHSLGANVTLFAAEKRPDLFKKLIFIEPVFLPRFIAYILPRLPISLRKKVNPTIPVAQRRRDQWPSQQHVFDDFRAKKVFSQLSDASLMDYVRAGTKPDESGQVILAYSKAWEVHVYATFANPWPAIKRIQHPFLCIRGANTDVIPESAWRTLQKLQPDGKFINMENSSHLLPFEHPEKVGKLVLGF